MALPRAARAGPPMSAAARRETGPVQVVGEVLDRQAGRRLPPPHAGRARRPRAVPARHLRRRRRRRRDVRDRRCAGRSRCTGSGPPAPTAAPSSASSRRPTRARRGWPAAAPGTPVDVVGPAGPAVRAAQGAGHLRAGREGCASAPLFSLAERLRERECAVHMLLGAATEAGLFGALEARRATRGVTVATADGSVGLRGGVVDALPELLDRTHADVVYAAGPHDVLHGVARAAEAHGAWSQTAVDVPDALRHRTLPGLRAAGGGRGRRHPDGPGLRRGAGVPRRPGALGRPRLDPVGRPGCLVTADLAVDLAGLALPSPLMTAAGCGGRELATYTDLARPRRRSSPARSRSTRRRVPRRRGSSRRRAACCSAAGPRTQACKGSWPPSCRGTPSRACAPWCRSVPRRSRSTPSWPVASPRPRASRPSRSSWTCPTPTRPARSCTSSAGTCRAGCRCWPSSRPAATSSASRGAPPRTAPTPWWSRRASRASFSTRGRCGPLWGRGRPAQRTGRPGAGAAVRLGGARRPAGASRGGRRRDLDRFRRAGDAGRRCDRRAARHRAAPRPLAATRIRGRAPRRARPT